MKQDGQTPLSHNNILNCGQMECWKIGVGGKLDKVDVDIRIVFSW